MAKLETDSHTDSHHVDEDFKRRELRVVAKLDMYVCPILIVLQLIEHYRCRLESDLDRRNLFRLSSRSAQRIQISHTPSWLPD